MNLLKETLQYIAPVDAGYKEKVYAILKTHAMPGHGFGKLADMAAQYAAIVGKERPELPKNCMVITAADHGVAQQGISAYPVETTLHMVKNYLTSKGGSANAFANFCGADMVVADMGVAGDLGDLPGLWQYKIAYGTKDFTQGPAMSRTEAIKAVEAGIAIAKDRAAKGYTCFSLGEMGIGNTTSSAAIAAAFTGLPAEELTGRGTGISDSRMKVKLRAVKTALSVNRPDPKDGLDVLAKIGGFEIGALAGVILGAAACRCAVVLDGLNTTASALIACAIQPLCREYLFASHLSGEPAHVIALRHLGLKACIHMRVRLGEAIGASVVMNMLALSLTLVRQRTDKIPVDHRTVTVTRRIASPERLVEECLSQVRPLCAEAMEKCQLRLDNLTKPLNSLGHFEHLALKMAGIMARPKPYKVKKSIIVFLGTELEDEPVDDPWLDVFTRHIAAEVVTVTIDEATGTEAAGDKARILAALAAGIGAAKRETAKEVRLIGMGTAGKLAIADDKAAELLSELRSADDHCLLNILCRQGVQAIAAMVGGILGSAAGGAAVVLDTLPGCVAALLAVRLHPGIKEYLIGSTLASDPVQNSLLEVLEIPAYLDLDTPLAAGQGAALGMMLVDASLHMLNDMKTFGEAEVAIAQDGPGALRQSKDADC